MSAYTSNPVSLPEQFGPYRILRPLGEGGMGTVYLARDTRLDRDVALKVCHLSDDPTAQERFRQEAKAAAGLSHPNLCPVYEFDVRDGIAYLTTAFIEGPTLNVWTAQRGGFSQHEAAILVAKLALAMQAAHDAGVIHRDLKPTNIIMNKQGEAVILDFGLARQMKDPGTRVTQLGAIYGTPAYMAPEQAGGDPTEVGPAADQYSLGVILYELLTGRVPFQGSTSAVLVQLLRTVPVPPRNHNPAVDPSLEEICLKAMAKKPEGRYPTLKVFAENLAKAARGLSKNETVPRIVVPPLPDWIEATKPDVFIAPTMPLDVFNAATLPPILPRSSGRRKRGRALPMVMLLFPVLLGASGYGIYHTWYRGSTDQARKDDRNNSFGMTFVHLPKGTFYMGWAGPGIPGKKTEIEEDFEIAIHTVTQGQWQALMNDNPSMFRPDGENAKDIEKISAEELKRFPVENMSWEMMEEYIAKLNEKEHGRGWTYRLPSEAEWEYSCRGGATSEEECSHHFYFDKPTDDLSSEQANFDGNYVFGNAPKGKYLKRPVAVDSPLYKPNKLGLTHMHGNVWQWCSDPYAPEGSGRVVRGGSWGGLGSYCRAGFRSWVAPASRTGLLGFRLARVPSGG